MRLGIVCLALVLLPASAAAQSFNCRYARSADEVLICQDGTLQALDERMATQYAATRNSLSRRERRQLEAEQAKWLRSRRDCGRDINCVESSYRVRIRELRSY